MERELAVSINAMLLKQSAELNNSVALVRDKCVEVETKAYLNRVSHMMALLFDVLDEIYREYPDLKPESFK